MWLIISERWSCNEVAIVDDSELAVFAIAMTTIGDCHTMSCAL